MADPKPNCCFCHLPRADRDCPLCAEPLCRHCIERLADDALIYLETKPAELCHGGYCPRCFDATVAPALQAYSATLERAKNVGYWARAYRGHVPVIKKALREIEVEGCRDRDDALMRLGFKAASLGFNGLIHGNLVRSKVRNHGYQTMQWTASALPALVDEAKLERHEFNEAHWRVISHR